MSTNMYLRTLHMRDLITQRNHTTVVVPQHAPPLPYGYILLYIKMSMMTTTDLKQQQHLTCGGDNNMNNSVQNGNKVENFDESCNISSPVTATSIVTTTCSPEQQPEYIVLESESESESVMAIDKYTVVVGATATTTTTTDPAMYLKDELYARMRNEPETFDWIQNAIGDGIFYWDLEHLENEWMSPSFKELFGYTDEEVPNTAAWWQANMFEEDSKKALEAFHRHIELGEPYNNIVRYRHKDGSTVWVRCHGRAFFDANNKPIRMLGAHVDLTELMLVHDELKKKEAVLDLLCTTSLDGFWDWDMKTGSVHMSIRFKNLLGYNNEELPDRIETWWSLLLIEDVPKLRAALKSHQEENTSFNVVLRYRKKDLSIAYLLAQGVAQRDENTNEFIRMFGTHTDVSYLEEARAAKEASAAKSTFLATMSHEIRTPLNAVLGMAEILRTTSLTEDQADCVHSLYSYNSGSHLLSLINDVLDFSQIESGTVRLVKEEIDIQRTVRNVLDVLQHCEKTKNVVLTFNSKIKAKSTFIGDSERVRQIFYNLVGNAVKFTSQGSVGITLTPEERNGILGVHAAIQDTGCGIATDKLEGIFEDFTQANNEIRSKYGGSGLGLSISKKLIYAMGGTISVESVLAVGSTFSIWIPGLVEPEIMNNSLSNTQVVLIENMVTTNGSIADRLSTIGLQPICINKKEDIHHIPSNSSIILHCPGHEICVDLNEYAEQLFQNSSMKVVDVGRKLSSSIRDTYQKRYKSLPRFPTTDETLQLMSEILDPNAFAASMAFSRNPELTQDSTRRLNILVAEDNLVNQKVIKRFLCRCNCDVEIANNGQEAVNLAKQGCWDVIFLDLIMPIMDGLQAAQIIRKKDKVVPIIALTANATTDDRESCINAGMNHFLTKPISLATIETTLAAYR